MSDLGHDLLFGVTFAPEASDQRAVVAAAVRADELGLDLVGFQDHPYHPGFLDVWALLSFVAARTRRVRLFPDVINLPLRPPAVLARSAAALDILSGGRVELGLGAGARTDAVASMGGPRRTVAENVDALEEGIHVLRSLWAPGPPVRFRGTHYQLDGAQPGPLPPHRIGIHLGAYKPRMLRITARLADGWIPSIGHASFADLARMSRVVDAAAEEAGRAPGEIRRMFNLLRDSAGVEQLTELALEHGFSGFVLAVSPHAEGDLRWFAEEVAPAVREAVQRERARGGRPAAAALEPEPEPIGRAGQQTLLAVHDHLRQELGRLRDVIGQVAAGGTTPAAARSHLQRMTMRQNYWTMGAFCAAYCRVVSIHHTIEDQQLFPELRGQDETLAPVLQRLREEHEVIAEVLDDVDQALVATIQDETRMAGVERVVERLSDLLLTHLRYEEDQLLPPIGRYGIGV